MNLILIRHGETDWNRLLRIQGITDNPLNDEGIRQAKEAAEQMQWLKSERALSSPLQRSLQTAEIFCFGRDISIQIDDRLCEISYGVMEGEDLSMIYQDHAHILHSYFANPEKYMPPEDGESLAQLKKRCGSFLREMMLGCHEHLNVLVFTHGAVIRGMISVAAGLPDKLFWNKREPGNCSVSIIRIQKDGLEVLCESERDTERVKSCLQ